MLYNLILIGFGGFLGAILRFDLIDIVQSYSGCKGFPYGTLAVNLLGCLIIGAMSQIADSQGVSSTSMRSFIFLGLLGSFTTFSTFGSETVDLFSDGENFHSFVNISIHIHLGLGTVWFGRILTSFVAS